jgi:EpsD family peptidyl-prolyl cis-trans isomerase
MRINLSGIIRVSALVAMCGLVLVGCGKKSEETAEASKSQIVARVGNEVVTAPELDNEFRLANVPIDRRKDPAAVKKVLGDLVTRKYVVRQALNEKLDREPTVLLDILRARELVLANAVGSRDLSVKSSAITSADIDKFIADNPLKFANRQILSVEQIVFPADANTQALVDATNEMKTLDEVDQKLAAANIPHNRANGALSSGDVAPELFNLIEAKQADNIFFTRSGPNGIFFKVTGRQNNAVEGENAIRMARQLLRMDLLKTEANMMAVAASLEAKYEGDYAVIMGAQ